MKNYTVQELVLLANTQTREFLELEPYFYGLSLTMNDKVYFNIYKEIKKSVANTMFLNITNCILAVRNSFPNMVVKFITNDYHNNDVSFESCIVIIDNITVELNHKNKSHDESFSMNTYAFILHFLYSYDYYEYELNKEEKFYKDIKNLQFFALGCLNFIESEVYRTFSKIILESKIQFNNPLATQTKKKINKI